MSQLYKKEAYEMQSALLKWKISLPTAKSDNYELMHVLRHAILKKNRKIWHNVPQLQSLLMTAGLPLLPDKSVQTSLKLYLTWNIIQSIYEK